VDQFPLPSAVAVAVTVCTAPASVTLSDTVALASAVPLTATEFTVAAVTVAGTISVGAVGGTVSLGTVAVVAGLTPPAVSVAVAVKVTVPSFRLERSSVGRDQAPVEVAVAVPLTAWPEPSDAVTFTVLAA
jgi:hypothetical protein